MNPNGRRIHLPGGQHQPGIQVVGLPNTQLLVLMTAAVRQAHPEEKEPGAIVREAIELISTAVYWDARGVLAGAVHAAMTKAEEDVKTEQAEEEAEARRKNLAGDGA